MAIMAMKHLHVVGMQAEKDGVLHLLQQKGCVEVREIDAAEVEDAGVELSHEGASELASAKERKAQGEAALAVLNRFAPQKSGLFRKRPVISEAELFDPGKYSKAQSAVETINKKQRDIAALTARQSKLEAQEETLKPWLDLDVDLNIPSSATVVYQFGTIPAANDLNVIKGELAEAADLAELIGSFSDKDYHYLLLVAHSSQAEAAFEALKLHGWARANLKDWDGTALDNTRRLESQIVQIRESIKKDEADLSQMGSFHEDILRYLDCASVEIDRAEAKTKLLDTEKTFVLEGWVTAESWQDLKLALKEYTVAYEVQDPVTEDYPQVPVKLKNNKFTWPLNMVTEMYSLPAYGSVDPNPLMAPFFVLFYGIMMADMGYGILMFIAGTIIASKYRPKGTMGHMMGLLQLCGISTFIFGALTGGFFGDFLTQLLGMFGIDFELPSLFTPLNDTLMILIGAMCLGFIQICVGMVIGVYRKFQKGEVMAAVWEEFTWWIVIAGIALMVLGVTNVVLIVGGVMVVVGSFYTAIAEKGLPGGILSGFTGLFASLYNNVTGYFSDILSYSRLMALMLAGSVIAQVFNTLGAIPGNVIVFVVISMVGNALNFALNLLGCYVHDLRLQCLEYFGRFYEDGGKPFAPVAMNTKYVDIQS